MLAAATLATVLGAALLAVGQLEGVRPVAVAAWLVYCAVSNVLPVPAGRTISLSMSSPVNIAIAAVFPPAVAVSVVALGSLSEWELRRDTTVLHALFNRAQLAIATGAAALALDGPVDGMPAAWRTLAAIAGYQLVNWLLVGSAEWTSRRTAPGAIARRLVPQGSAAAVTYLALGAMGIVLALTSQRVGVWAVALLMIPLIGARHAVKVSRDLERAERERRSLSDRLIDERERERVRIASDLHDVVLQQLAAVQLHAANLHAAIARDDTALARRLAGTVQDNAADAIADLRRSVASLRRDTMDDGGLVATLERHARSFHAETHIPVRLHAELAEDVPLPVALLAYECCQEALTNVARHAGASAVDVHVRRDGSTLELRVRDDGVGLRPGGTRGLGLVLTADKVALAGGACFVERAAGGGTEVCVRIPLPVAEQ